MSGGFPGNAPCQRAHSRSARGQFIPWRAPHWFTCYRLLLVSALESIHFRRIWQSSMLLAQSESSGYCCQADAVMRGGAAYSNRMRSAHIKAIILFPFITSTTSPFVVLFAYTVVLS